MTTMKEEISLCPYCYCMTKTLRKEGKTFCGKCKEEKISLNPNILSEI
jgi:hypothetical protein